MRGWQGDLRSSLRSLRRTPGLSTVMVLTLGLGIGASSAIFSIVDGVLLQSLPVPEPDRLVYFTQENERRGLTDWQYSYAGYRAHTHADGMQTTALATVFTTAFNLVGPEGPRRIVTARVSDTFFPVTGLQPARGRAFSREEEAADAKLLVISHEFWVEHFGAEATAIGRSLDLQGVGYQIIGIMPAGARLLDQMDRVGGIPGGRVDLYVPLEPFGALQGPEVATLRILGRMSPGVTVEQASAEGQRVMEAFQEARGISGWTTKVEPLQDYLIGGTGGPLLILLGAVGALVLMVCANLSGLLLVRAVGRSSEWAARRALGASSGRIVRQILTEVGAISLGGGAIGLGVAGWAVSWVRTAAPVGVPRIEELGLDWRAFIFSISVAIASALVVALFPAVVAARRSPAEALASRGQTLTSGRNSVLRGLVVMEVAVAVVLLAGSGVLLRSLNNLLNQDPGYTPAGVLRGTVELPADGYGTDELIASFATAVEERLRALPGVEGVAIAAMPIPTEAPRNVFQRDGNPEEESRGVALQNSVTPDYFNTLDIEVVEGRAFTRGDVPGSPLVAIVTKAFAEDNWPGESALGKRLSMGSWRRFMVTGASTPPVLMEVVGVVEDLHGVGMEPGDAISMVYSPYAQDPWANHTYVIRATGSGVELASSFRGAVAEIDANQPMFGVEPMRRTLLGTFARERLSAFVLTAFASVALLLSVLGIYGVVAYSVVLRKREIGIRLAVGGERGAIAGMFFREGLGPVLIGVVTGMLAALWMVQSLRSMLYQVSPVDPIAFSGAGAVLGLAALASTYLPAQRTAAVDPIEALRPE